MPTPIDNTSEVVVPATTKIDPAVAKADAYQKQLSALSAKVNSEAAPTMYSAYSAGRGNQFSAKQFNQAKYATYGSEIYGKLGFNPYQEGGIPDKKSGMDVLYDDNTTTGDEYYRASKGMLKLAGIGVQDTFGLNAFASDKGYLDFEDVMNKYSSSRGGVAGFVANTMVSAGYTVGIIGGIALEELALAGITGLTGGAASAGTIAAGGTALVRGLDRLKNLGKTKSLLNEVRSLENVEQASTWLGRGVKSKLKALGPGNTYDFLKNVDAIRDLNGWKQTALGVGAVVRDARKITMAHSESKLEADLARKEFVEQSINVYYEDSDNVGKPMSDKHQRLIESESNKLHDRTYTANFGLIYVTNAIMFDNMFKNMRGTNRFFKTSASEFFKTTRNVLTGKVAVSPLAKTLGNITRKKLASLSVTGTLKKTTVRALEGSVEGGQELGQDLIANSMKSYHARNVKGTQLRGGFFDLLDKDVSKAAKGLYSEQGGITFASGALMGMFAAPFGFVSGKVSSYLTQGGINNSFNYVTNQKEYKANKATLQTQRLEKAKRLTEFFNDNKNFIDGFSNGVYTQNELQEQILKAGETGNLKEFKDKQHESFVNGVHSLLEAGLEKDFADHLDYMGSNFDAEHLNEVFGRTDITDETKGKYQQKLKDNAKTVRALRKTYVDIQDKIINPNSMKGLKVTDEKYLPTYIKYRAFENFKKELLFSHANIADRTTRLQDVHKEISNETPLTETEANALISPKALADHIKMLEIEVSANKDLNLKGDAAESAKQAVTKLEAYKNYQVEYKKHLDTLYSEEGIVYESDSFDALAEAYNNVVKSHDGYRLVLNNINANDNTNVTETNNQAYAKLFDYINMSKEKEAYEEHVKTLMNPSGSEALIKNNEDFLARLDANKEEHIKNALKAFEERTISDEMLNELYNEGLFFDLHEIDDLINNRVMPSQIYNINDNTKATPEQVKRAQEIIGAHIKRLTGKSIVNAKSTKINQGRKYIGDKRTLATLVRNFKLKIGTQIKLSSKEGQSLLEKILDEDNKFLTDVDKEILLKVLDQDATIKFVTDGIFPVQITDNGVIELDLRFASQDFVNSKLSFENLLTTGLVQKHISDKLKEDDDLWLATRNAMEQAKDVYTARYPGENIEELEIFDRPELFLTEAMNDIGFQDFLSDITDTLQPASKSLWDTMMSNVKEITKKDFDKKLINRVINIAAKALDSSIIENISETTTAITPEMLAAAKAKEEELRKVAAELGLRWNVNVKVVATQAEASEILGTIKDPFFQKFNDILSDLMYGSGYREFKVTKGLTEVSLKDLLKSIYDNSESTVELIANLKELSLYQTNGRFTEMVDWIATNGDNIADGLQAIKDVFFQTEGKTTAGFYDEKTNTAYIVADAVKPNTVYHEIFLHPFLINQEKSNPEFYKSLVAEAMNNAEVVAHVEKNYGTIETIGARQYEHELIGRVYDLNINNQLDKVKDANLIQKLGELIKGMFSNIAKWLGINKGDIKRFNEKKTTIADLAKYSVKEETTIDLGKVIEADISYVKPPAKTKTTVTKTSTIVTPTRVNKGGNVITTKNARDRKDIFGEFIHPEIKSDDAALVQEWTNKITEIGQALDAANITDWKYGEIRADVDGRLVIDVSAEIPVMATTTSTTNTASADFVKLQDELKAIEERIANLSKATSGATQDASYIANQEFEEAQKVINFSRNKFPGNKMPLYQYLRMLNNTIPVVGQFAYFVNRDNTNDPVVDKIKRGIITSINGDEFTYINQEGNSITDTTKSKTLEFANSYFLFADSEVVNDLTYPEAEAFIKSRRDAKIKSSTGTKADIERINKEWQEELEELNEKNLLSIIHKIKFKDGSTINDLMPNFSVDDANILAETGFKNVLTKQELEAVEKYRTRALRIKQINAKYEALLAASGTDTKADNIKNRKRKDLFPDKSEFAQVVGNSEAELENEIKKARYIDKNETKAKELEAELERRQSKISSYKEVNGIGIAEYTNPKNGLVDVIMTGTSDNDYVGYVRVYTRSTVNGKVVITPTERWTSKMENMSQNKANIKTMLVEVQKLLPAGHEYTEKTNISLDGLKTYAQQLNFGYEILLDNAGNFVTQRVSLNKASVAALKNATSQTEIRNLYNSYKGLTRAEYNEIKAKINELMPQVRVLPFNESVGDISIDLPVLKSTKTSTAPTGTKVDLNLNVESTTENGNEKIISDDSSIKMGDEKEEFDKLKRYGKTNYYINKGVLGVIIEGKDTFGRPNGSTKVNVKVPNNFDENIFAKLVASIKYPGNTTVAETERVLSEIKDAIQKSSVQSQANPNAQKIQELENQKKDLEEKLKNEPEFIAFDQAQSVQTGTKTVKFLMYKSTGTGSTAASLGEWVPLLAFGEHSDGREWFVKGLHEGLDPKLNKYGSVTFADINQDLKSREDSLFVNENWITEDVESTVTEEVEVEEETIEPSPITERIRQDAASLKAQFDSKSAEFERLTNDLNGSSANFRQRLQIKSQLQALAIEINDLAKQLEDAGPLLDQAMQEEIFGDEEVIYTPKYDYNDNEIVTHETPWMTIPLDLRTNLATLYGKAVNRLAQADVDEIRKNMKSNPAYITVISDFSNDRLNKQNQEIGKIESIENQKKTAASNAANQLRVDAQKAQDRLDKKIARDAKPELAPEELMRSLLPNFDYSILTEKEIDKLVAQLRDTKALVPFTVNDIIAYISEKKRKKALIPNAKRDIQLNLIEAAKQAVIKENLRVLYQKKFGYVNSKNKGVKAILGDDMVKFIIFYHPEIFSKPKLEFIDECSMILRNRAFHMKNYKVVRTTLVIESGMGAGPIEFNKENIAEQLVALVAKLEKEKTLFPSVAKLINLALFKAGSDLRLFIAKSKDNATLSSMYTIGNKRNYTAKPKVKNGDYGNIRDLIKDQELDFDVDLNMQIALVQYFTSTAEKNKITLSVLESIFKNNATEIKEWMYVVSDDSKKADMKIISFDGFADSIFENAGLTDDYYQEYGKDAIEKFFLNNSNLTDTIKDIGEQVLTTLRARDEVKDPLDDENYDAEEFIDSLVSKGFTKEEAYDNLKLLTFLSTEEGRQIKDEEAQSLSEYYNSPTFLILNGEFKGNYNDLSDSDKALYDEMNAEPEEEDPSGKEEMNDEDDDFGPKREVETPISKQIQLFYQDTTDITVPFGKQISNIWGAIKGNQQGNIVYAIAAYKFIDEHRASTDARKAATATVLNEAFSDGYFSDVIVNYENKAYRIDGYVSGKIRMQDLENSNVYNDVSLEEFMTGTIEELQVGDEFNNMKINSFAKVQEIQYIKDAYTEIFNNFTTYIGEADALSDDALLEDLRTEITKCK